MRVTWFMLQTKLTKILSYKVSKSLNLGIGVDSNIVKFNSA